LEIEYKIAVSGTVKPSACSRRVPGPLIERVTR
jgi:hypothetical protein